MSRLAAFWRNLAHRRRAERELDEELRSYVAMLADENRERGMPAAAARRAALLETAGIEQLKEQVRDIRAGAALETLSRDVRFAFRTLARSPAFTAVAIAALALGIGANTAIFSVVYGVLLRPLPFPEPDRLAMVYVHFLPWNNERGGLSPADYFDWKAENRVFEKPAVYSTLDRIDLTGAGEPEQVRGSLVTPGFFDALRVAPLLGRVLLPSEETPGSPGVVVLSETLWRRRFGASSSLLGSAVTLNGRNCTIVGIMPASFHFPRPDTELWANLVMAPPNRRGPYMLRGIGRLKPGVTLQQAQAAMNAIGSHIEAANPNNFTRFKMPAVPLCEAMVGNIRPALLIISGAVFCVLLISVVNVANLMLARGAAREREMSVRLSLGAGRGRLVRQLLTESTVLAIAAGTAGLTVAYGGIRLLRAWNPGNLPRIGDIGLDGHALAFTLLVSIAAGVLFALAPALRGARADLNASLKEGARSGTAGAAERRKHGVLAAAEIALSLMLLVAAGLALRSFSRLQQQNPGFEAPPQDVLTMTISPGRARYSDEPSGIAFYHRLLDRLRHLPGVEAAAVSDSLPPDREGNSDTFQILGDAPDAWQSHPSLSAPSVSPGYFQALGIPLLKGRRFDERDQADSPLVAIISESMARRFFAGRDPIGMRMKQSGPNLKNPYLEIVGVVGDSKYLGLDRPAGAAYYLPYTQSFALRMFLVARSNSAAGVAPALRREIHGIDPDAVITGFNTLDEQISNSVAQPRFRTGLLAVFAAVALVLAAIGIYGVISYAVSQRTHEIALRMALGARRGQVLRFVLGEGARLVVVGIAAGMAGSIALARAFNSLLFDISPTDPLTFAAVSILIAAIALAAAFIPAHRAARVDPLIALRHE